jgi:hypothetical protein
VVTSISAGVSAFRTGCLPVWIAGNAEDFGDLIETPSIALPASAGINELRAPGRVRGAGHECADSDVGPGLEIGAVGGDVVPGSIALEQRPTVADF